MYLYLEFNLTFQHPHQDTFHEQELPMIILCKEEEKKTKKKQKKKTARCLVVYISIIITPAGQFAHTIESQHTGN